MQLLVVWPMCFLIGEDKRKPNSARGLNKRRVKNLSVSLLEFDKFAKDRGRN